MAEKVFRFELGFDGDSGNFDGVLRGIKSSVRSAVNELQQITGKVELFGQISDNIDKIRATLQRATERAADFRAQVEQIQNAGGKVGDELATSLRNAENAAAAASKELARQEQALAKLDFQLKAAGVDTTNLAKEQVRLAEATAQAAKAEEQRQAFATLGIRSQKDLNTELAKATAAYNAIRAAGTSSAADIANAQAALTARTKELNSELNAGEKTRQAQATLGIRSQREINAELQKAIAAYDTIRRSGIASAGDIANAQKALVSRTKELNNELKGVKANASGFGDSLSSSALAAIAPIASITAVLGLLTAGFFASIHASNEWRNEMARLATITDATKDELAALSDGVRALARDMGFDAVEGVKALAEILRSGIPKESALDVLAASADLAKASLTDLGTTVKLTTALVNGYGVQVADLRRVFDVFFQGQKDGGATISEFAGSLGEILPVAKRAGISLEEIVVSVRAMVKAGLDAPTAIGALGKIIAKLENPAVVKNLNDIGIEVNGLVGTIQQIGAKHLSLDSLLSLGVSSEKTLKGLTALTNNTEGLVAELERLGASADLIKRVNDELDKTPQEAVEKLSAATKDLAVNIGDEFTQTNALLPALRNLFNTLSDAVTAQRKFRQEIGLTGGAASRLPAVFQLSVFAMRSLGEQTGLVADQQLALRRELESTKQAAAASGTALQSSIGGFLAQIQTQTAEAAKAINTARGLLGILADDLAKNRAASQAATAQALADIQARAAAQLAQVSAIQSGEIAAAEQIVEIQKKAAADRLKVILDASAQIQSALALEAAARRTQAEKTGKDIALIEQDITKARLAALAPIKAALEQHYNELTALARDHQDKITTIELERVNVNSSIEDQIRTIRRGSLTAYQAYNDQIRQIDELTSKARQLLATGDTANLKQVEELANRARAIAGQVGTAVTDGEQIVVKASTAQSNAVNALTEVQKILNTVLDRRKEAEIDGRDAALQSAKDVKGALADVVTQYDELTKKVAAGIKLNIEIDQDTIAKQIAILDDALAKQAHLVPIEADLSKLEQQSKDLVAAIKSGATDGIQAQADAILESLRKVAADAPELKFDITPAEAAVASLKTSVEKLAELKPQVDVTVNSNAADVQAQIDNLKKPTESTHTIHVKTVNERGQPVAAPDGSGGDAGGGGEGFAEGGLVQQRFARGGLVGAIQRFAAGGPVFRPPSWRKVPGTGAGDTVPAALQAGSFVVRRSASRYYGDQLMSRVAAGVAGFRSGGAVRVAPGAIRTSIVARTAGAIRRYTGGAVGAVRGFLASPAPSTRAAIAIPRAGVAAARGSSPGRQIVRQAIALLGGRATAQAQRSSSQAAAIRPSRQQITKAVRAFAAGGLVTKDQVSEWAKKTYGFDPLDVAGGAAPSAKPDTSKAVDRPDPPVSFDARPVPEEFLTAQNVISYATEMLNMVGQTNPMLGVLGPSIIDGIRKLSRNPSDQDALKQLLRDAETIGSNPFIFGMWGKTQATIGKLVPIWFIDWLTKRGFVSGAGGNVGSSQGVGAGPGTGGLAGPAGAGNALSIPVTSFAQRFFSASRLLNSTATPLVKRRFAQGGATSDTVPAMLTPGEWIIRKPAVDHAGHDLLRAINRMEISREHLGALISPPVPMVQRFAGGGPVIASAGTGTVASTAPTSGAGSRATVGGPSNVNVTINANAGALLSAENVRRYIIPEINAIMARSR